MQPSEIAAMIDVSAVRADSTLAEVGEAAALAMQHGCVAAFALPSHTPFLLGQLAGSRTMTGGVVGFPGGAETTSTKAGVAAELVGMGCDEIDMVNNIAWLKAGSGDLYLDDIRAVVDASDGKPVKVILECHWLTDDEITRACEWCVEAGATWVKTGTGWAPTGATLDNTALIKRAVGEHLRGEGGRRSARPGHTAGDGGGRRAPLRHRGEDGRRHSRRGGRAVPGG
jgi:deoxyribose-phosphate aldolase